uniref:Transposase Tc1-like domain-containing protein n=1 Tax=Sinocyclocheilus anshuiensis TaxID=1608454 RepID=A0A671RVS7_9TELE
LKVSQSVISRLQQRNRKTGRVTEMHRSGCLLATSHADDRFIVNSALRNRMMKAILQARLREHGLRARRPTHLRLTRNQWASVLFSDESPSSGNGCWRLAYLKWSGLHFLQT